MRAIFLSDAHLRRPQDRNYQLMLEFLNRQKKLDALFLLGDIFEFWIGYRHLVFSNYIPLLETLRRLSQDGTRLYFVEGNHDFLLGSYFSETLHCNIIPDQQVIDWDGKKIHLCHGDLIRPNVRYRIWRGFLRSPLLRAMKRVIHPDLAWSIGLHLSSKSRKSRPGATHQDPAPFLLPYVEAQAATSDIVICGHYHHPLTLTHGHTKVVALGDWINQFSYAELEDGIIKLKSYPA